MFITISFLSIQLTKCKAWTVLVCSLTKFLFSESARSWCKPPMVWRRKWLMERLKLRMATCQRTNPKRRKKMTQFHHFIFQVCDFWLYTPIWCIKRDLCICWTTVLSNVLFKPVIQLNTLLIPKGNSIIAFSWLQNFFLICFRCY